MSSIARVSSGDEEIWLLRTDLRKLAEAKGLLLTSTEERVVAQGKLLLYAHCPRSLLTGNEKETTSLKSSLLISGWYWVRTSDLSDRVGGQRVTTGVRPRGRPSTVVRFQPPPSEPDGHLSAYPALQRHRLTS